MAKGKQVKEVQIVARIEFKCDSKKVIYQVRSSNGKDVYETSMYDGKATGCNCPSRVRCQHKIQLEAIEAMRTVIRVGDQVVSSSSPARATEKALDAMKQQAIAKVLASNVVALPVAPQIVPAKTTARPVDSTRKEDTSSLGYNQGFNLLKQPVPSRRTA